MTPHTASARAVRQDSVLAAPAAAPATVEVQIDGRLYDITGFKHPGGSILRSYAGQDASAAFHEFHYRSTKAAQVLRSLKSRDAEAPSTKLQQDFEAFRRELEAEGWFEPSWVHVAARVAELFAMHALAVWLVAQGWWTTGLVVLGIAQGRCGWLMHEGGHHSLTGVIKVDVALQRFFYGTGCGMSASWWRNQHNKHHATPQRLGYDCDLETLPLVAFATEIVKLRPKLVAPVWLRLQSLLFGPVTTFLVTLLWQLHLHPRHIIRTRQYTEALWVLLRLAVWFAVGATVGAWITLKAYMLALWVSGMYIFINFALSHTHLPTAAKEGTDWVRYAALHTMNVEDKWWVNWWMAYLNFQIEHHLFPSMPQYRQPRIAARVQQFFKDHDLPYLRQGYFEALYTTFRNLHTVGYDAFLG